MTATSRTDLNVDQDENDEIRDVENFEDGDIAASRPNFDRQLHTHHKHVYVEQRKVTLCPNSWIFSTHLKTQPLL